MGARTAVTPLRVLIVAILMAVAVGACGRSENADIVPEGEQQQQPEAAPAGEITLQCSAECAARGQCGKTADGADVVLLNLEGPNVEIAEHDLVTPVNTPVTVQEVRPVTLVEEATGAQFQRNFYWVFVPSQNVQGWVVDWCLAGPLP